MYLSARIMEVPHIVSGEPAVCIDEEVGLRGRILVVDDERGPRQSLRMLLKEQHEVALAEDVSSAKTILEQTPIDLVITDMRMPQQTGIDLLQWMKRTHPDIEVIILTGFGQLDSAMKAVEYGAFAYIEKPFDSMAMMRYVQEGLEKRRRELERCQLEQLALEANRFETLGRFVSGMLHDLGTPLTIIGSQIELALLKNQPPELEKRLQTVLSQVEHCSDIVRATMGFLRHNTHELATINLNDAVNICLEVAHPLLSRQRVETRVSLATGIPLIKGDFTLVRQALLNLITNACQAMESQQRPGLLDIVTGRRDDRVFISVGDNGPGIPPEARLRVFNTFYTTKGRAGTGLGLAVVKNVMQRHSGSVHLAAHATGGALFSLEFPIPHD
ncbi:MAG TPA: hybrid sensor histidine kinase/response regulator [Candidatus Hydrogenedentes bacterium]|nr:hybrid sensor histidine kinase/response regulator [Candidatus Hydrogenedentota bacterium]